MLFVCDSGRENPARLSPRLRGGYTVVDPKAGPVRGISALGDALGYYRELAMAGLTATELAARTASSERFAREWLARQAGRGHIDHDPQTGRYSLNERQRASIWDWNADPPGPAG
jgi:hypothetical protein